MEEFYASMDKQGLHIYSEKLHKKLEEKNLSASTITGLYGCHARWAADSFVVKEIVPPPVDTAATRGQLYHSVMEEFFAYPPDERTNEVIRKVVAEVMVSENYKELGESPGVEEWLKNAINGYYKMGGKPRRVEIAQIKAPSGEIKPGLEYALNGRIRGAQRPIVGFIDQTIEDPQNPGSMIVQDWKGLALDTPIPTPTGWTTMEQLGPGDRILGSDGDVVLVTKKSGVHNRPCYTMTLNTNEQVTFDNVHLWNVEYHQPLKKTSLISETLTGDELYEKFHQSNCNAFSIRNPQAAMLAGRKFPADPHEYGFGAIDRGRIEDEALFSSWEQRVGILRGMIEAAGSWNEINHMYSIELKDEQLAQDTQTLVSSLGMSATIAANDDGFVVLFIVPDNTSASTVKDASSPPSSEADLWKATRRFIVSIEKTESVPTQCIEVDAPDSLYLFGKQFTATHNTGAKAKRWNPKTKNNEGLAEQRQQIIYSELLRSQGHRVSGARLIYPVAGEVVNVDLGDEALREKVLTQVEEADEILDSLIETNTFEYSPSFLCSWCPLVNICPVAEISHYKKPSDSRAQQPSMDVLAEGIDF